MIRLRYIWIKSFSVNDRNHVRFSKRLWSLIKPRQDVDLSRRHTSSPFFSWPRRARTSSRSWRTGRRVFETYFWRRLVIHSFHSLGPSSSAKIVLFQFLAPSLISSRVLTRVLWHWERASLRIFFAWKLSGITVKSFVYIQFVLLIFTKHELTKHELGRIRTGRNKLFIRC